MIKNYIFFLLFTVFTFLTIDAQIWTQKADLPSTTRRSPMTFTVGDLGYAVCGRRSASSTSAYLKETWSYDPSNDAWTKKADFPGSARSGGVAFVIDSVAYVGLGWNGTTSFTDMYKYDVDSNKWDTIASYPGLGGVAYFSAALNGKGYVGGGGGSGGTRYNDFWEYDPVINSWRRLGNLTFGRRANGPCFAKDTLIYMGMGLDNTGTARKDMWSYNPMTSTWRQLPLFPGDGRVSAKSIVLDREVIICNGHKTGGVELGDYYSFDFSKQKWKQITGPKDSIRSQSSTFSINGRGYMFAGQNSLDQTLKDLWEIRRGSARCDSLNWDQREPLPDSTRRSPMTFSIRGLGYSVCGRRSASSTSSYLKETWSYNPSNDAWTRKADFPGIARSGGIAFVIDSFAYVGLGWDGNQSFSDLYKYNPDSNKWSSVAAYPGLGGVAYFSAVIDRKAYVGGGGGVGGTRQKDFWEYNPTTNAWTQLGDLKFGKRANGISFSRDSIIYLGMGLDSFGVAHNDFWSYNTNSNDWTKLSSLPGDPRVAAKSIVFDNNAIICAGHKVGSIELSDYYTYNFKSGNWRRIEGPSDSVRSQSSTFTINGVGYLFAGQNGSNQTLNDLWSLEKKSKGIAQSVSSCGSYTWAQNSKTYTQSGNYFDTLSTLLGCDSIVELNLIVNRLDTSIALTLDTLRVGESGANYQWIDCANGIYTPIIGETNQYIVVNQSGDYACEVTKLNCTDTTQCVNMVITNIENQSIKQLLEIFPNPAKDFLTINYNSTQKTKSTYVLEMYDTRGRKVLSETRSGNSVRVSINHIETGLYHLLIIDSQNGNLMHTEKVIVE